MEAIMVPFTPTSERAVSKREVCPRCRAPIVGTRTRWNFEARQTCRVFGMERSVFREERLTDDREGNKSGGLVQKRGGAAEVWWQGERCI